MDDPCAILLPVESGGQLQQAAGAFKIAAGGAAQRFQEDLNHQGRFHRGLPVTQVAEQVLEIGQIGLQQGLLREWSVLNVPLAPGWAGALAAAGTDWRWVIRGAG